MFSQSQVMRSCCAIAQFKGTMGTAKETMKHYAESRNENCHKVMGVSNKHTFVIMSFNNGKHDKLRDYIRRHKLGHSVKSKSAPNVNHSNRWTSTYGRLVTVVTYQPDHVALTKWYKKNFNSEYELPNQ